MIATTPDTRAKATWETQKARLRSRFPKLTGEDLNFEENRKEEMLGKLELKLALTAQELQVILETN